MISPSNAIELVLSYQCRDPKYAAVLTLDALFAAGYVVVKRENYIELLTSCVAEISGVNSE